MIYYGDNFLRIDYFNEIVMRSGNFIMIQVSISETPKVSDGRLEVEKKIIDGTNLEIKGCV